jgi:hypothetical protein
MKHTRKLDDAKRAEALERIRRGEKFRTIGWELGVSESLLCRMARANGIARRPQYSRRPKAPA